eukprot:975515_1
MGKFLGCGDYVKPSISYEVTVKQTNDEPLFLIIAERRGLFPDGTRKDLGISCVHRRAGNDMLLLDGATSDETQLRQIKIHSKNDTGFAT